MLDGSKVLESLAAGKNPRCHPCMSGLRFLPQDPIWPPLLGCAYQGCLRACHRMLAYCLRAQALVECVLSSLTRARKSQKPAACTAMRNLWRSVPLSSHRSRMRAGYDEMHLKVSMLDLVDRLHRPCANPRPVAHLEPRPSDHAEAVVDWFQVSRHLGPSSCFICPGYEAREPRPRFPTRLSAACSEKTPCSRRTGTVALRSAL